VAFSKTSYDVWHVRERPLLQPDCPLIISLTGPVLLGDIAEKDEQDWRTLPPHADEHQVDLDVERAFVHYPVGELSTYASLARLGHQAHYAANRRV
jgi:hypothetical protein